MADLETLIIGGVDLRTTPPGSVPPGGSVKVAPLWTTNVVTLLDGRQRTLRGEKQAGWTVTVTVPDGYAMPAAAAQALFSAQGAFGTVSVTENLSGRALSSWAGFVEELDLQEVPGTNRAAYTGSFRLRVEE